MTRPSVTAGLRCAPETGPNARIRAIRAAPVAIVLASSAMAALPPASRSAMIPEPTTAASRNAVPRNSAAARRTTAGPPLRLGCSYERAEELVVYLRCDFVDVHAGLDEKLAGIFNVVDPRGLHGNLRETRLCKLGGVFIFFERTGDAAYPEQHALAYRFRNAAAHDHIGDCKPPAGFEHSKGFAENSVFVCGEVDNAVGDDDVDGVVRQWDAFDFALQELDIRCARPALVFARQ